MDKRLHKIIRDVKFAFETVGIHINKIILFGSYAKGTANKYSDIDIAVISNDFKDMNLLRRFEFIGLALAKAKIMDPVEVRVYTEEEFETKREGTFVCDEIKAKGIEVML